MTLILEYPRYQLKTEKEVSYSEWWRYKGSEKPRQPRKTEGASLSELSNNKRIWNYEITRSAYADLI